MIPNLGRGTVISYSYVAVWSCGKQNCLLWFVSVTTAEAEYVAAVQAAKTGLWLASMVAELRQIQVPTVTLIEDNQPGLHSNDD